MHSSAAQRCPPPKIIFNGLQVFGYRAECADCSCEAYLPAVDIAEIRQRQELWIFGTHHKTGSFLNSRIWDHLRQAVTPHLNIKKNEFKPMDVGRWGRLAPTTDVVVTYHAQGISKDFVSALLIICACSVLSCQRCVANGQVGGPCQ